MGLGPWRLGLISKARLEQKRLPLTMCSLSKFLKTETLSLRAKLTKNLVFLIKQQNPKNDFGFLWPLLDLLTPFYEMFEHFPNKNISQGRTTANFLCQTIALCIQNP